MPASTIQPNSFHAWMMCMRPKTWGAALAPVILGLSLSYNISGHLTWTVAVATCLLSVFIQIITNMENDAAYTRRKAEKSNRKGLPRATSMGLLSVTQVERMIYFFGCLVAFDTFFLMTHGGWLIICISIASVIAAYFYMGGSKPLAYTPWSDAVCFLFFGVVAVCGTVYLQLQTITPTVLLSGMALGALVTDVLVVNNYRDIVHDSSIKRCTLAVVLGKKKTETYYACLLCLAFLLVLAMVFLNPQNYCILLGFLAMPFAFRQAKKLPSKEGYELNAVLFDTVRLELIFTFLLSMGFVISRLLITL